MKLAESRLQTEIEGEITHFLRQWNRGDEKALDSLLDQVYNELKVVARSIMIGESANGTLCPTALVNEVYIRFVSTSCMKVDNRAGFFWFIGRLMRRTLVDHARSRLAARRGAGVVDVSLEKILELPGPNGVSPATLLALDQALRELKQFDERQCRIVEMRYFAGLNLEEISGLTKLSQPTIKREWRTARAWLAQRLSSSRNEMG